MPLQLQRPGCSRPVHSSVLYFRCVIPILTQIVSVVSSLNCHWKHLVQRIRAHRNVHRDGSSVLSSHSMPLVAISWLNGKPGERYFSPKPRAEVVSRLYEPMCKNKDRGDGKMESCCLCTPDKIVDQARGRPSLALISHIHWNPQTKQHPSLHRALPLRGCVERESVFGDDAIR